jgi:Methyltransferase domain
MLLRCRLDPKIRVIVMNAKPISSDNADLNCFILFRLHTTDIMNTFRRLLGRAVRIFVGTMLLASIVSIVAYIPSNHPHEKSGVTIHLDNIKILPNSKAWDPAASVQDPISITSTDKPRPRITKPTWGVDKEHPEEYWFDSRIHTLGNHGFWGAVHAAVCPLATKVIDVASYQGIDVRQQLAQELSTMVGKQKARVLDLCCGVGISTRALQNAFPDATAVVGMDTSKEMVRSLQLQVSTRRKVH